MKNNDKILKFLKDNVGRDFTTYDAFGCADTVNNILDEVLGYNAGGGPSTHEMYKSLQKDSKFEQQTTQSARPGDLILSPTGYGNGNLSNGHVGFLGENGIIYSNNSNTSKLDTAFTAAKWKAYYKDKGGFPVVYYRAVAPSKVIEKAPVEAPKQPIEETFNPSINIPTINAVNQDDNRPFWQSVSKLVFLSFGLSATFLLYTGKITTENWMILSSMVFGYYFKNTYTNK